jgi:hypothetical protein
MLEDPSARDRFHRNASIVPYERVRTYNRAHPDAIYKLCRRCGHSMFCSGPHGTRFKFTLMKGEDADRATRHARLQGEDRRSIEERFGTGPDDDEAALEMATYEPQALRRMRIEARRQRDACIAAAARRREEQQRQHVRQRSLGPARAEPDAAEARRQRDGGL